MSKKNLLIDKLYISGVSKARRGVQRYAADASDFEGHPSMKKKYAPWSALVYPDPLRMTSARYWGFKEGLNPPDYGNFGYLRKVAPGDDHNESVANLNADNTGYDSAYYLEFPGHTPYPPEGHRFDSRVDDPGGHGNLYFGEQIKNNGGLNIAFLLGTPNSGGLSQASYAVNLSALYKGTVAADGNAWNTTSQLVNLSDSSLEYLLDCDNWNSYVGGTGEFQGIINTDASRNLYYDHAHQILTPYSADSQLLKSGAPVGLKIASVTPSYNYFFKSYEEALASGSHPESILPNAYALYQALDYNPQTADADDNPLSQAMYLKYKEILTLNNSFASLPESSGGIASIGYGQEAPGDPLYKKTYLQKYAIKYPDAQLGSIPALQKYIGFSKDLMENDFIRYGLKDYFPFQIDVEFDTSRVWNGEPNKFATMLESISGSFDFFLQNIMMDTISGSAYAMTPWAYMTEIQDLETGYEYHGFPLTEEWGGNQTGHGGPWSNHGNYDLNIKNVRTTFVEANRRQPRGTTVPILDLPYTQNESSLVGQTNYTGICMADNAGQNYLPSGIFVGQKVISQCTPANTGFNVWKNALEQGTLQITKTDFTQLVRKYIHFIRNNSRSYVDILRGELAYSEIIAFKVEKYVVPANMDRPPSGAQPVQSFYFPNLTAHNKIKYRDTQVKFGQKYRYKVYAYNLVVGDSYTYDNVTADPDPTNPGASFFVHQFPSVQIVETPYYEFENVEVRDYPPVFPDVEVVPYRGVDNKMLFLLNTQDVKYAFNPEKYIINESDLGVYQKQREFQNKPTGSDGSGLPIIFGSDDPEVQFEIFRTTEKPDSYTDFSGLPLVSLKGSIPDGGRSTSVAYLDTILPNTKYYYTFRCIDYHGGMSIPSPVHSTELVSDNGRIFPITEVFQFNGASVKPTKTTIKEAKRYLQIGASMPQALINTGSLSDPNTAGPLDLIGGGNPTPGMLSTQDEGIWSTDSAEKLFKIRVTSKHTGKKIDLNITFKEEAILNPYKEE